MYNLILLSLTEPWWLRGLMEHNQFLTLKVRGSNPGVAIYVYTTDEVLSLGYMCIWWDIDGLDRLQWVRIWRLSGASRRKSNGGYKCFLIAI